MNGITIFKTVATFITSTSVGAVVGNMAKASAPASSSVVNRVLVGVGAVIISSIASEKAASYVEEKIDNVVEEFNKVKNQATAE